MGGGGRWEGVGGEGGGMEGWANPVKGVSGGGFKGKQAGEKQGEGAG